MTWVLICSVALLASALTFFSGFGLGTLLLPAFALFFPLPQAIAMTAVVHLLNGLFKVALVGRHADRSVLLQFGLPAVASALLGAWLLGWLGQSEALYRYTLGGHTYEVQPLKAVIGVLLALFAAVELIPTLRDRSFAPHWLPLGGALSGFFGGLSGMQGALRAAFLVRAGLSKQALIGTGAILACLIDLSRIGIYAPQMRGMLLDWPLLAAAVLSAFLGAWAGNRWLHKVTLHQVQRIVAVALFGMAIALMAGWV